MSRNRFTSKQHALNSAVPVYACESCRAMFDAPLIARCTKCNHIADAIKRIPGKKANKHCPNCARPTLKNERTKPFSCNCGCTDFLLFDSTGEYRYFAQLALLQDHGKITNLERQKPFSVLIGGELMFKYYADFVFTEVKPGGNQIKRVLDYKGSEDHVTDVFKLKRKIVQKVYGIEIEIVS